ncbi:MAG: LEA type 2 family protein [Candidatus Aminicenantales bacterium]
MGKRLIAVELGMAMAVIFISVPAAGPSTLDIAIALKEKKVESLSPKGLTLLFYFELANSSSSPCFLVKYDYRVMIEDREYLSLQTPLAEAIRIESRENTLVALPLKVTYALLFQVLPELKDKDVLECFLGGGMTFQDERRREKRVPMVVTGEIPVFKELGIKIQPIETRSLSIGGAELNFKALFQNPNAFILTLEKLSYRLELAGKTVAEGEADGEMRLNGHGEEMFSLPLLLDFFEIGKDVYQHFESAQVFAQFSGRLDVITIWGKFQIPFQKSEEIAVLRAS